MKKLFAMLLALAMVLCLFAGCAGNENPTPSGDAPVSSDAPSNEPSTSEPAGTDFDYSKLKICILIHGLLGDNGYFDSAAQGGKRMEEELGCKVQVVEMGKDASVYEANLADASESGYDLVIMGGFRYYEIIEKMAEQYPDQKYIMYDNIGNFTDYKNDNVYAYSFASEQGSFLAGALAALCAKDTENFEFVTADSKIGVLCSADEPMLNNFVCGYIQGAAYVNPDVKVLSAYIGSGQDTVKAKELALQMFSQGASVVYTPAGQTIMSIIEAAKEKGGYIIGCDNDQYTLIKDTDPEGAALTLTSALKPVGDTLFDCVKAYGEGKLPFGTGENLGLKEGGSTLAYHENYIKAIPQEIRDQLDQIRQDIIDGKIEVWRASDKTPEEVTEYRNSFLP